MAENKAKQFITGNDAAVLAALHAGASFMGGYPITPATEILEKWSKLASLPESKVKVMQTEDEIAAGFSVIGAILAGKKAFTATAGIGHVLMQDPISMAEAMRIPFVGLIAQRGGPSTGTVIYGQQEVTLASYGGNGEGLRVVYSTANPQEIYDYTLKAFQIAWKHHFPTFVLFDGYQSKMRQKVIITKSKTDSIDIKPIIGTSSNNVNIRNCYNFENELSEVLGKNILDYDRIAPNLIEYEEYHCSDAKEVIFAHGIISQSAKKAVDMMRAKSNRKIGLFRPITLRPFPKDAARKVVRSAEKIIICESSNGHFARIVRDNICAPNKIETLLKPVLSISPEEIIKKITKDKNDFWA